MIIAFGRFFAAILMTVTFLVATAGDSQATNYGGVGLKGVFFMPDMKSDGCNGAELFMWGGDAEAPIAIEMAIGYYSSKPSNSAYSSFAPVYATITGLLYSPPGPVRLYAGVGIGFYYGFFYSAIEHGHTDYGAGYGLHAVVGTEILIGNVALRGEVRGSWASVDPGGDVGELDVGGIMAAIGIGFRVPGK